MSWSPSSSSSGSGSDMDDEGAEAYRKGGYLAVRVGDRFKGGRYVAQRKLGWGHFSTVWLAYDTHTSEFVALKIQKSAVEFAEAAHHEIKVLSAIADGDPSHSKCIARLVNEFKHAGPNGRHICLVLEFLGDSLLKLIRYNKYRGIGLDRVREVCRFILIGLDYLHRELGIIHADLKPENVLLVSTIDPAKDPVLSGLTPILERPEGYRSSGISSMIEKKLRSKARRASAKLLKRRHSVGTLPEKGRSLEGIDLACKIVDFGNACWANDPFSDEIQTRQYRSPEVVLCSGYSFPVDMWSLGCIAFELATGDMLFNPTCGYGYSEDEDHLALMMEILGRMPRKIACGGSRSKDYFDKYGDLKRIRRLKSWPLERILIEKYKFSDIDAREFAGFLLPLLDFTPEKRPSAAQCLQHPWLTVRDHTVEKQVEKDATFGKVSMALSKLQVR